MFTKKRPETQQVVMTTNLEFSRWGVGLRGRPDGDRRDRPHRAPRQARSVPRRGVPRPARAHAGGLAAQKRAYARRARRSILGDHSGLRRNLGPRMAQEDPCTAPCTTGIRSESQSKRASSSSTTMASSQTPIRTYSVHLFVRTPPSEKPPLWSSLTIQRPSPVIFMAI